MAVSKTPYENHAGVGSASLEGRAAHIPADRGAYMGELGERIRAERVRRGLRQFDLAVRAGISPAAISKIERDEMVPSVEVAGKLAHALGMSIGEIVGEQASSPVEELVRRVLQEEFPGEDIEALVQDFLLYISLPPEQRRATRQFARFLHDQEAHAEDAGASDPTLRRGNRRNRGAG